MRTGLNKDLGFTPEDRAENVRRVAEVSKLDMKVEGGKVVLERGSEEKQVSYMMGKFPIDMKGQAYLLGFILPNFYFHYTTAYTLLRHNGVGLGKGDFIGRG